MKGSIFCPECFANLFRSPEEKEFSSNGRVAYFAHSRVIKTDCGLRTKRAEGKKYLTEEDAKRAILNEELVIVEGFIKERPISPNKTPAEYDASQVEEIDGPVANVPIGRHKGEAFKLPSKFKTIRGICNKFDENITRYFYMPNGQHAIQLQDLLKNIESVTEEDEVPRIYYGKIIRSANAGKTPQNIRMTKLQYTSQDYADFYFKLADEKQREKGIDDNSAGRVVVMYGKITKSGAGLCIEKVEWGEFALLPRKYECLLY
ncbi:hypothetical protein E5198_00990 [Pseudomonas sp. A-1]|nr:hypothetical protein E5198_00990 [Pseudomonas sp. A-1]